MKYRNGFPTKKYILKLINEFDSKLRLTMSKSYSEEGRSYFIWRDSYTQDRAAALVEYLQGNGILALITRNGEGLLGGRLDIRHRKHQTFTFYMAELDTIRKVVATRVTKKSIFVADGWISRKNKVFETREAAIRHIVWRNERRIAYMSKQLQKSMERREVISNNFPNEAPDLIVECSNALNN